MKEFDPDELLVGIGSAQVSHTVRDPFTAGERFEMVARSLQYEKIRRFWVIPIPDINRHAMWVSYVESLLPPFDQVYSGDPLTRTLFRDAGYEVPELPFFNRGRYEGTEIRRRIVARMEWRDLVPLSAKAVIDEIGGEKRVRLLASKDHPTGDPQEGTDAGAEDIEG